jgi:hypothetical protein
VVHFFPFWYVVPRKIWQPWSSRPLRAHDHELVGSAHWNCFCYIPRETEAMGRDIESRQGTYRVKLGVVVKKNFLLSEAYLECTHLPLPQIWNWFCALKK